MSAVQSAGLQPIAMADMDERAVLAIVWKAGPSPALRELLEHCREAFARGSRAVAAVP
jgi:hypothetical protein